MADPVDVLTALGSGYVTGKAQRKRENELIQLEQKENEIDRKERRRADLIGALSRFASSGLFDMDTIIGAMQDIPAAVQSEVAESALYRGLQPRTALTPSEQLREYEAETDRYKAQYPKPETELDIEQKKANILYKKQQIAYYKALEEDKKKQTALRKQYENAKTEKQELDSLRKLEDSYRGQLRQIDSRLEDPLFSMYGDPDEVTAVMQERTNVLTELEIIRGKLKQMGNVNGKDSNKGELEELSEEGLIKMLDRLESGK